METEMFSMWSGPSSYLEDNLGDPFELLAENQPVKRRLGGWCEMTASLVIS
jgi:hypothetical protein